MTVETTNTSESASAPTDGDPCGTAGSPRPPDDGRSSPDPSPARLDAAVGARLLASVGFLLVPCDPALPGPAYLFVAIRGRPTLAHFDPEGVEYWRPVRGRGIRACLDRALAAPISEPVTWGAIRIVDRLGVANEFLACGGWLEARRVDGMVVAVFSSPAPILCGRGHSQDFDPGAQALVAFFARLRAVAGSDPAAEARIDGETAMGRYAAFVADMRRRSNVSPSLQVTDPATVRFVTREASRLQRSEATAWRAGTALLSGLAIRAEAQPRG